MSKRQSKTLLGKIAEKAICNQQIMNRPQMRWTAEAI